MNEIIHQYFDKNNSSGYIGLFSTLSETWKSNHPTWSYKQWGKSDVRCLLECFYPDLSADIDDALLPHIARYLILYKEGGVYADWDFECIEPFDGLLGQGGCSLFTLPDTCYGEQCLSDAIILSEAGHPFLEFVITHLKDNLPLLEKEEHSFINKMYRDYERRNEITILPFSLGIPCTRDEIRLYERRLLTDDDIQQKIQEAYSICYYKKERTPVRHTLPSDSTDILYVSTSAGCVGGAFNAGYRIHQGLRDIGLNSKLLVLHSGLTEQQNKDNGIYIAHRDAGDRCGYDCDMEPLREYPRYSISSHGFSPAVVGVDIVKNIDSFGPRLVILHGINGGFATIEDLGKIRQKVVWRLPDCWAVTGGCYYFADCKRYLTGCGRCPKLGSDDPNDLSHQVWKRKSEAWKKMDMTIVVPTLWMKKVVENSTLLKDKSLYVIPNGLDLNRHYPINKRIAREALQIPQDKKVILFGAINAFDPRKGFSYLIEALRRLSSKHKDEYYLAVFGMGKQQLELDVPVKFLGYLHDPYLLQLAYSSADVMAVPSVEEAFGQTVTEAMACAVPVVSFEETGPADIIEHLKTGYLARYLDGQDLAKGIEWILDSKERIEDLSRNARKRIEQSYDINLIAREYEKLYHHLLQDL